MKLENKNSPSKYVPFDVDEKTIEREWEGIRRDLERRGGTRKYGLVGLAAAAVIAITVTVFVFGDFSGSDKVSPTETTASMKSLTLPDGSRLQMDEFAEIEMGETSKKEVSIAVSTGRVLFDVPTDEERNFTVSAGNVMVVVKGTRFSVEVKARAERSVVEVSVLEGKVEIKDLEKGDTVALNSGRSWSSTFNPKALLAKSSPEETPDSLGEPDKDDPLPVSKVASSRSEKGGTQKPQNASSGPGELFKRAQQENAKGNSAIAADLFNELVSKHKSDSRAPLAAFQLGRLRMDALGDTRGALRAFNTAVRLGPSYPFVEDVEARRVEAFERLGRVEECLRAKKKYLTSYPGGVHVGSVERRCAD